jgi:hypothetical protein
MVIVLAIGVTFGFTAQAINKKRLKINEKSRLVIFPSILFIFPLSTTKGRELKNNDNAGALV